MNNELRVPFLFLLLYLRVKTSYSVGSPLFTLSLIRWSSSKRDETSETPNPTGSQRNRCRSERERRGGRHSSGVRHNSVVVTLQYRYLPRQWGGPSSPIFSQVPLLPPLTPSLCSSILVPVSFPFFPDTPGGNPGGPREVFTCQRVTGP